MHSVYLTNTLKLLWLASERGQPVQQGSIDYLYE